MKTVFFRFYEELNDFLPKNKRKKTFEHNFMGRVSVKDMIESLGVPHTEIDLILVNRNSIGFDYIVADMDKVSVYPEFESLDITDLQHLRFKPLRMPKFVLDVHLGKLSRLMRMLGLDTLYENYYCDEEIVTIATNEKRCILTRDIGILKRNEVNRGYWIRNIKPKEQLKEIINRFDLLNSISRFTRCILCNGQLTEISKNEVIELIPPKVEQYYDKFFTCTKCERIYWRGSHIEKMNDYIQQILEEINFDKNSN